MDKDKLQNAEWSLDVMITQSIEKLREIMLNYDIFSSIAEKLEWLDMEEQYDEWRFEPCGIELAVFKFPQDYIILRHIEDVYVRVALSTMAHYEGWEPQFWNISQEERKQTLKESDMLYKYANLSAKMHYKRWEPQFISQKERKQNIKENGMLYMFENYAAFKELRLVKRDWTYLANEIRYFSDEIQVSYQNAYQKLYLDSFEDAKVIELGSRDGSDASYWAIKRNKLLVVSCFCWN